jgi:carbon-monoxide dehydrogenase large subunit
MTTAPAAPVPGLLVGARVRRPKDPRLLSGQARYLDDLHLAGMAHAAVVRSPIAHGRLVGFDASEALAQPDVLEVLTPEIVRRETRPLPCVWVMPGQRRVEYPVVPDVVRYVGEPLGLVVARSRAAAEDAIDSIEIDFEELEVTVDPEAAVAPDAPLLFGEWGTNVAVELSIGDLASDVEAAIAEAPRVVERTLRVQRQSGMPIEPRGIVARADALTDEMTIWMSSQAPHHVRDHVARCLNLAVDRLRVIVPEVGGGFGTKEHLYPDELLVCLAARRLDVPVKWVQDRREALLSDNQEREQVVHARLAFDDDGRFLALGADVVADMGAFPTNVGAGPPWVMARMMEGQYRFPVAGTRTRVTVTNKAPLGAQRGFGMPVANWSLERLVDEAARELGLDPVELRRRNMIRPDEMPYPTRSGMTYDSGEYERALDRALELVDLGEPPDDGRRRGVGVSGYVEFAGLGPSLLQQDVNFQLNGYETSTIRMETDGTLTVTSGVMAMGQGIETTLAQVAADAFGLGIEDVNVVLGDTSMVPYSATGSIASRSMVVGGAALMRAGARLRRKVLQIAAHQLEAAEEDLEIGDRAVRVRGVPGPALKLADVARSASLGWDLPEGMAPGLEEKDVYDPQRITFGFATNVAAVAVDVETGEIEIERFVVVHDCGVVINPMIVDGQVQGAIANGLGTALLEALVYDEAGQPRTTTFMDYLLPSSSEVPDLVVDHTVTPSPHTPGGMKGVGEGGTIGAPAAIGNALASAVPEIAHLICATPLSPSRVWEMLRSVGLTGRADG